MARPLGSSSPAASDLLAKIIDEDLLTAQGVYGFWPAASDADDIVLYTDAIALRGAGPLPDAPPAARQGRAEPEPLPGRLRGAGRDGSPGLDRRLRRHRRNRGRRAGGSLRARRRRLPRHHDQGAGRPTRRGLRRVPAPAGAPGLGLRRRRRSRQPGADRREVPRNPPGLRIPRLSGPQREACGSSSCWEPRRSD